MTLLGIIPSSPFSLFSPVALCFFLVSSLSFFPFSFSFSPLVPSLPFSFVTPHVSHRFKQPGMPTETPIFDETLCEEIRLLADKWLAAASLKDGGSKDGGETDAPGAQAGPEDPRTDKFMGWPSPQKARDPCFGRKKQNRDA